MLTRSLQGNMLSFYLALALDLPEKAPLQAPWDAWECDIGSEGRDFGPFDTPDAGNNPYALLAVMPTVSRWQLSSRPLGSGQWIVEAPDGKSFSAPTLIHSYALAIVGCIFGDEVPNWYEDRMFAKNIFLPPYNVPYGQSGPDDAAPHAGTFNAPPAGSVTYSEALNQARAMVAGERAYEYTCDGHSWVQVRLLDGSVHSLYSGESTIGLAPSPST